MEMDACLPTSKETIERYYRKYKLSFQRSIVKEVSLLSVLPDSERRRERIT
jgi:hypothetical protein